MNVALRRQKMDFFVTLILGLAWSVMPVKYICAAKLAKGANFASKTFFQKIDQNYVCDDECQSLCWHNLSKRT